MAFQLPLEKIKRDLLVKQETIADPSLGEDPNTRPVSELIQYGIINLDKPKGPTSHQVSDFVQNILGITKAGHSGTLDPGVTGVLPVALGRATRIVQALLPSGKEYVCVMHIHDKVERTALDSVLKKFVGKIMQMPPIRSAVKRQLRQRRIYYLEVMEIDKKDVLFRVGCQAGTYIRKLCSDIGKSLGCGAHMAMLRRTKAGSFDETNLYTLQEVADAFYYYKEEGKDEYLRRIIQPVESAVKFLPKIWVMDNAVISLCHGRDLGLPGVAKLESGIERGDQVAIMTLKDEFIGFGEVKLTSQEIISQKKGIAVSTHKVFMKPEKYKNISLASG